MGFVREMRIKRAKMAVFAVAGCQFLPGLAANYKKQSAAAFGIRVPVAANFDRYI